MGIRPTDAVILPPSGELIHRVERDSETRDFGQKERPPQEGHTRRSEAEETGESDTVEVSAQSLVAGQSEEEENDSALYAPALPESDPPSERHIDIQA
jgi:hypothetical protein